MDVICNFRIFDLDKYRKIQPIIESIKNNTSDKTQVTSLIQEAIAQTETDVFNTYNENNNDLKEIYINYLQCALNLVQTDRVSELSSSNNLEAEDEEYIMPYIIEDINYDDYSEEKGHDSIDIESLFDENENENDINCTQAIDIIILLLCCPKYQESMGYEDDLVSEGTVEYTNIYGSLYLFNQNIHDLIDNVLPEYQLENLHLFNRGAMIIKKEFIPMLTLMVSEDLSNLCQPDNILYLVTNDEGDRKYNLFSKSNLPQNSDNESFITDLELHSELITFYTSLNNMLILVNSQPNYTVINENLS